MSTVIGNTASSNIFIDGGISDVDTAAAAGNTTNIQYNSSGLIAGDDNFSWTAASNTLTVGYSPTAYWAAAIGSTGALSLTGAGAGGSVTITPTSGQGANVVLATTGDFKVNSTQLVVDTSAARVGVNTAAPATSLDVLGTTRLGDHATNYTAVSATGDITQVGTASFIRRYASTAISATLDATYDIVEVTASTAIITLPTAVGKTGRSFIIDNSAVLGVLVNTTSAQTIEGELTQTVPSNSAMEIYSNGSNWRII
jgi:hypothetical protein